MLEGGGSGKTTNLEYLCETLKEKNVSFIKTREPEELSYRRFGGDVMKW